MNTEAYQLTHIGFIWINFRFSLISVPGVNTANLVMFSEGSVKLYSLFSEIFGNLWAPVCRRGHSMSSSMKRCGCLVLCWELTRSIWERGWGWGGGSHMCLCALQTVLINTLITFIHTESILIFNKTEKGIKSLELGGLMNFWACSKKTCPFSTVYLITLARLSILYTARSLNSIWNTV